MKKLHLVGFTQDNDGLILSPRKGAKSGGYVVALDDELVSAIGRARREREGDAADLPDDEAGTDAASGGGDVRSARPRSALSPREIQARLRAGSTTADVAAQAGVEEEWVLRFADPILAEQAQVVDQGRRLTFAKSRLGPSAEPLGESVQWNLTDRGVRFSDDVFASCWSAFNLHGARWALRFTYTSRQRRQIAEWEVDLRERSLTARNRLASDLGHVEQGRRRPRLESPEPSQLEAPQAAGTAAPRSARKAGGRGAQANKAAGPKSSPAGMASPRRAAKVAGAKAAGAKAAGAKAGSSRKPAPVQKSAAKRSGREASPRKSGSSKKPAADTPGSGHGSADAAVPEPEPSPERPSHLARPPSPMNMANRATSLPGRRSLTSFSPIPSPSPSRPPSSSASPASRQGRDPNRVRPAPPPESPQAEVSTPPPGTPAELAPEPPPPPPPPPPPQPPPARSGPVAPPLRRPSPPVPPDGGDGEQRPAVVILSNPPPSSRAKRAPVPTNPVVGIKADDEAKEPVQRRGRGKRSG